MQNAHEIFELRTMLRDVNVEYSALVRSKGSPDRRSRMMELKRQRHALMSRIGGSRQAEHTGRARLVPGLVPGSGWLGLTAGRAGLMPAIGAAGAAVVAVARRYWAAWMGGGAARERKTA